MDVLVQLTEKVTVTPTCMHGLSDQESDPVAVGSQPGARLSNVSVPQGVLVRGILCHARFAGRRLVRAGVVVTQVFGFHLLIQVVSLSEVTQVGIV